MRDRKKPLDDCSRFCYNQVMTTNCSDTATTIATPAGRLWPGDVVFHRTGDLVVDALFNDAGFGTWVYWTNGERDSYPVDYKVYRVVEA